MSRPAQAALLKSVAPGPMQSECLNPRRNPFCGKYEHCLKEAARLDLPDINCSRCFFRDNQSGRQETRLYLSSYLELLKIIVQGDRNGCFSKGGPWAAQFSNSEYPSSLTCHTVDT